MTPAKQKFHNEMQLRGFSLKTIQSYMNAVVGLSRFYGRSPESLSEEEIKHYLLYLIDSRQLARSTCNQAVAAFKFFYSHVVGNRELTVQLPYRKRPKQLPVILNRQELSRLFEGTLNPKHRMLLMTAYSSGVRASELVRLKVTDIDSHSVSIRVNGGKGNKDRLTVPANKPGQSEKSFIQSP